MDNFVDGLYSKDGRLINDRPNSMMGIEKAAKLRKMVKNKKILSRSLRVSAGLKCSKGLWISYSS